MSDHIVDGEFQSDKYPSCPRGKVPLSVKDVTAQDLLWKYAQRRRAVDAGFSEDLETCLLAAGFVPAFVPAQHTDAACAKSTQQVATEAFMAGVEYGVGWLDEAPDAETEAAMYAERVTSNLGHGRFKNTKQGSPESQESDPVLRAEERRALLAIRRLVAATAKSCDQQQEYIVQIALLDRLLRGDVSTPVL